MATPTYTPLQTITLGSSASSVTFSNIPNTYRDLVLIMNLKTTSGAYGFEIRLNGDSGTNYSRVRMQGGDGTSVGSDASTSKNAMESVLNTDSNGSVGIVQLMDYSATDKHKTVLSRNNYAPTYVFASAYRWANTAAVTTILIQGNDGESIAAGSTASLYGIAA